MSKFGAVISTERTDVTNGKKYTVNAWRNHILKPLPKKDWKRCTRCGYTMRPGRARGEDPFPCKRRQYR